MFLNTIIIIMGILSPPFRKSWKGYFAYFEGQN